MREDTSVFNMGKESIMSVHSSDVTIYGTFIAYNRALDGPALFMSLVTFDSYGMVNIRNNNADQGVLYFELCQIYLSGRTMFNNNTGSISIINSDVFFNGVTYIYNCSITINTSLSSVLSIQLSTVVFNGTSIIANNKAVRGGAISMIDSTAFLYGNITIGNNAALLNAGGLYLYKSQFHSEKGSHLIVYGNKAGTDGGGISAQSSTILVMNDFKQAPVVQNSRINVVKNRAKIGGGMSLWNSNLHIDSSAPISLYLADNTATHYGGAIYVDDYSNEYMCNSNKTGFFSSLSLCFLQMISDTYIREMYNSIGHMYTYLYFSQNYAMMAGSTIFGGLLNRCLIQNGSHPSHLTGFSFLKLVSNIGSLTSVSSHPVGVCFCKGHQPNCSYKHPTIYVMKGYLFMLSVVAVDQVNNTVKFSTIASFLSFGGGGLGIDQHAQKTEQACTELKFNVFSIDASTELNLLAQGPCRDALPSTKKVKIVFIPCSCPIGFQPTHADETKCKCGCDPELPYKINTCDPHNTTVDFKFNCC